MSSGRSNYRLVPVGDFLREDVETVDPRQSPEEVFELWSIPAHDKGTPEVVVGSQVGSHKKLVKPGDVLLSKIVPHIQRSRVVGRSEECRRIIASTEWIVFSGEQANPQFLREVLTSELFHRKFMETITGVGGSLARANPKAVSKIKIPLPPFAEQRKIAEILRTWDEAIETAEAELKAKQERKRWIMDRLFKFAPEEQLEVMKMQSAVDIVKGEQLNRHTLADSGSFPVWNGGVTPSGYTESYNTEGPAVIMSEGGNSCGVITYVRSNFWRGGHCYQVVPNQGFTNGYIFAALKYYEPQVMRLRVGSGLPNIQKKTFLAWGAPLHKSAFREKVAIMFSQAQLEANLVSSRIDLLRSQKRGLMQKLLTGEVRVAA